MGHASISGRMSNCVEWERKAITRGRLAWKKRSRQHNLDSYLLQSRHNLAINFSARNNFIHHAKRGHRSQHHFAEFGMIGDDDALACPFDHRALRSGLIEIELGQAGLERNTPYADKGFIYLNAAQCLLR